MLYVESLDLDNKIWVIFITRNLCLTMYVSAQEAVCVPSWRSCRMLSQVSHGEHVRSTSNHFHFTPFSALPHCGLTQTYQQNVISYWKCSLER